MTDYPYEDDEHAEEEPEPIFDFDPEPLGWGENGSADNLMINF